VNEREKVFVVCSVQVGSGQVKGVVTIGRWQVNVNVCCLSTSDGERKSAVGEGEADTDRLAQERIGWSQIRS
jgi:hypothetical protein